MLRALLLLHITALAIANPFHKYPYVFLLDVGNEELEKVNTEQIRISKQGGSLALRYPAIGNGEDIAHVRVSGIDFGTDLKADILDGGPGSKYVVLVLMGNQGVNFDAVITIQTVPTNSEENLQNINSDSSISNYQITEEKDPNDSAEGSSDNGESEEASHVSSIQENAELTQESSNVYSYAVNEALSGYGDSIHSSQNDDDENGGNDDDDDDSDEKDIHVQYHENENAEESNAQVDDQTNEEYYSRLNQNSQAQYNNDDRYPVIDEQNYASDDGNRGREPKYDEYQAISPNSYSNRPEAFPQSAISDESDTIYIEEPNDESPLNFEEIFSDEYDEDDGDSKNYSDKNNNFIDRNDGSAIAY